MDNKALPEAASNFIPSTRGARHFWSTWNAWCRGRSLCRDRAFLPQGRRRTPDHGTGAHAAYLLRATMVQPLRPDYGGNAVLSVSMRDFVGIDLGREAAPYETAILSFGYLLEKHYWTRTCLKRCGSARHESGARHHRRRHHYFCARDQKPDPDMHQTKRYAQ